MKVAVIGAGSWGTALARLISENGCDVRLLARDAETAEALQSNRENRRYLPDCPFPESLLVTADDAVAMDDADVAVVAVPSDAVRAVCAALLPHIPRKCLLLNASKGLESGSGLRLSEVIAEELPFTADNVAALSGPNLARELAAGVPTAAVIASRDPVAADLCRRAVAGGAFRVYTHGDIVGVELGGALKNVMAIAAGICEGLGFGDNTKAALLTRGLAEMVRLGDCLGADRQTFSGLSGIGDLIATAASRLSRNLRVGLALGQGRSLNEAMQEIGQVAEGVPATNGAMLLSRRTEVEMPIAAQTFAVLFENRSPREGVESLMSRAWKSELF